MSARSLRRDVCHLALTLSALAGMASVCSTAYAENEPREFLGRIGENEFATSEEGLQPNEQVRLNGLDDLSKVIKGVDRACVYSVTLAASPDDPNRYVLTVDGQGPQSENQGNLYLEFVDAARETPAPYHLVLSSGKRATHTVPLRTEGNKPVIKIIKWSNTPLDD